MSDLWVRVWQRYTRAQSLQIRAVSRFVELSLEAKPSLYDSVDPSRWRQMEQQVRQLTGQEIRTVLAVQRPNRLYLEERSAFGWFQSVCDGKVWQVRRSGAKAVRTGAPRTLAQMAMPRYYPWLGLEEGGDTDVLRLLALGASRLQQSWKQAKEQSTSSANHRVLVWSEPSQYGGMRAQGEFRCTVHVPTAHVQEVEYRYLVSYGADAQLRVAIVQRWDNSQLTKPPPPNRFRLVEERGARSS